MKAKNTSIIPSFSINLNGKLVDLSQPKVMGVLNATPDSFYAGSRYTTEERILEKTGKMLEEGATFLDLGGQSTRPGAALLSPDEERKRVIPFLTAILREFPQALISIDTYHSEVAKAAVEHGALMVNDISAGEMDEGMLPLVGTLKVPYIAMHMQGTPTHMQEHPHYENVTGNIFDFFIKKKEQCTQAGIKDLIFDPGFGFGKNLSHNYQLLKHLEYFHELGGPLLIGVSRKSMIYKLLDITPQEALNGTTALNLLALQKGIHILRVHDVRPAIELVRLWQYYEKQV